MLVHRGSLSSLHAAAASLAVAVVLLACTAPTAYGEDEAIAAPWDPYGVCYGKKYGASCDHPDAKYKCMEAYCGWDAYQDMYCVEGFKSLCKANLQCKKFKGCDEGTCQYENVEDGSSCDYDGNPCTQDYCRDGTCVMGPVKKCDYGASDYDAECVAPTYCDSKTRACPKKPYLYNGSDCSKAVPGKGLCKGSCSSGYCEVDKSYKTCTAAADDKDNGNSGGKGSKP